MQLSANGAITAQENWSAAMDITAAKLAAIAAGAGAIVMRHYRAGAQARIKEDRSPVTDADEEAEAFILAALAREFPDLPVAAEEAAAAGLGCDPCAHFLLVDPLDGTREFLKANGEFTVNIAEVKNGVAEKHPLLGRGINRAR